MGFLSSIESIHGNQSVEKNYHTGKKEGLALILTHQLEIKFGPLPKEYKQLIDKADEKKILHWSERVLIAFNLVAVFEGGKR